MFKNIKIENFRGLKQLEINDLKQFNLLVGKNESGKTSILEALFLLVNPNNPELLFRINIFRELKRVNSTFWAILFHKERVNTKIKLKAELIKPKEIRESIITVIEKGESIIVKDINKEIDNDRSYYGKEGYSEKISEISGLKILYKYFGGDGHKEEYTSNITHSGSEINFKPDKRYKEKMKGTYICESNLVDNLATRFDEVQVKKLKDKVIQVLKKVEPSIENLEIGVNNVILCDIGLKELVPINILGKGIIKILYILSCIISTKNGVVFIDEVENGLYHLSQEVLWDAIFSASQEFNVQIIATTHSSDCLKVYCKQYNKLFKDKDNLRLFRIEKENDNFDIISYNHKRITSSISMGWEVR